MRLDTGNRKGQTAILFTLAIVPLLGMVGLVVDIGWMYFRKEAAQTAADAAAAAAAAAAYSTGGGGPGCASATVLCPVGEYVCPASPTTNPTNNLDAGCLYAKENGFVTAGRQRVAFQAGVGSAPTATGVTINYYVVARVSESIPQLFSAVLGFPGGGITARASTGTRVGDAGGCVLTLNRTEGSMVLSGTVSPTSGRGGYGGFHKPAGGTTHRGGPHTPSPPPPP